MDIIELLIILTIFVGMILDLRHVNKKCNSLKNYCDRLKDRQDKLYTTRLRQSEEEVYGLDAATRKSDPEKKGSA